MSYIFLICAFILFLRSWIIWSITTLNYFWGRLSICASPSSGVLSCFFFWIYFHAISFCLTLFICGLCSSSCRIVILVSGGWVWSRGLFRLLRKRVWACSLLSGAASCPSMGRTVSREIFKGNCGLTKTLNSLPADGWGCVPALLVVWPEESLYGAFELLKGPSLWCQNGGL